MKDMKENFIGIGMDKKEESMGKKILLVDDDDSVALSLEILLRLEGYQITKASNGRKALEEIKIQEVFDSPISLIISDLNMPVMDGFELVEEVKKMGLKIPILVITASPNSREKDKLIQMGVYGVIDKPFLPEEIVGKVEEIFLRYGKNRKLQVTN